MSRGDRTNATALVTWLFATLAMVGLAYLAYRGVPPLRSFVDDDVTLATASLLRVVCSWFGVLVPGPDTFLFCAARPFYIAVECTGLNAFTIDAAVVLTAPVPWRARLVGLGIALPSVLLVNFARLLSLIGAGQRSYDLSYFLDYRFWPVFYVALMVYGMWRWYRWAMNIMVPSCASLQSGTEQRVPCRR